MVDERVLYLKKWYDYRVLTPDTANLAFLLAFLRATKDFNLKKLGNKYVNPLTHKYKSVDPETGNVTTKSVSYSMDNVHEWPRWKHIVQLRQAADRYGMRYDDFCTMMYQAVLDIRLRYFNIAQFHSKNVLYRIAELNTQRKNAGYIVVSQDIIFRPENYRGYEVQKDYYWYIIRSIREKYGNNCADKLRVAIENGYLAREFVSEAIGGTSG